MRKCWKPLLVIVNQKNAHAKNAETESTIPILFLHALCDFAC